MSSSVDAVVGERLLVIGCLCLLIGRHPTADSIPGLKGGYRNNHPKKKRLIILSPIYCYACRYLVDKNVNRWGNKKKQKG